MIVEQSPTSIPVFRDSPATGKEKTPLPNCRQKQAPFEDGYEISDANEDSFQNALNAILTMDIGAGSTFGVTQANKQP